MNQLTLPVTPGTLPAGSCPLTGDYQGLLNLIAQNLTVAFPSTFSGVTASSSPPADQTQVWLKLDSNGRPVRVYYFAAGAWLSQHPTVSGSVMIWPFPLPDFTTFDGGDNNAPSAISGPMWQQAQGASGNVILQAQFPIGGGTLPSGAVIAAGSTGGEEKHALLTSELAPHTHAYGIDPQINSGPNYLNSAASYRLADAINAANGSFAFQTQTAPAGGTGTPPVVAPHNTLPPYYGVWFLQRTNRIFYAS